MATKHFSNETRFKSDQQLPKALFKFLSQDNYKLLHGMNCHPVRERSLGSELRPGCCEKAGGAGCKR